MRLPRWRGLTDDRGKLAIIFCPRCHLTVGRTRENLGKCRCYFFSQFLSGEYSQMIVTGGQRAAKTQLMRDLVERLEESGETVRIVSVDG